MPYVSKAPKPCSVLDCHDGAICRGLCQFHYRRLQQYGDPYAEPTERSRPLPGPVPDHLAAFLEARRRRVALRNSPHLARIMRKAS
jgi:hypothetical protein